MVFKTNSYLLQVKSIAECSINLPIVIKIFVFFLFLFFLSGCFTQVLLYAEHLWRDFSMFISYPCEYFKEVTVLVSLQFNYLWPGVLVVVTLQINIL